jgi:3-deoxy-7-phosphoheptulonate synthase
VGFKNGTDGNVRIAVDAIKAAQQPHHFLSVTKAGHSAIVATTGNEDCHVILRGGSKAPNFDAASVRAACDELARAGLAQRVMIDASHANSQKNPQNQIPVTLDIGGQVASGEARIVGLMVESNLVAGRQDLAPGAALTYGQSITDGCIGWEDTIRLLDALAQAVQARRKAQASGEAA